MRQRPEPTLPCCQAWAQRGVQPAVSTALTRPCERSAVSNAGGNRNAITFHPGARLIFQNGNPTGPLQTYVGAQWLGVTQVYAHPRFWWIAPLGGFAMGAFFAVHAEMARRARERDEANRLPREGMPHARAEKPAALQSNRPHPSNEG